MLHGWIVIDKPVGPGSTQIVAAVKRALRDGGYPKARVGHGGTLDPLASGVLPIAIGEATKLAGRMLDSDKGYAFTIRFGTQTDTLDLEGAVNASSPVRPTRAAIEAVLAAFIGPIEQVPPIYSAIKIDGKRAYALARGGGTPEMTLRSVTVHALQFRHPGEGRDLPQGSALQAARDSSLRWRDGNGGASGQTEADAAPGAPLDEATLLADVSKGTYIRSLARDLAVAVGTVGHVTMLRRIRAGPFGLAEAISLDKLADLAKARALEDVTLPLTAGLDDIPALTLTPDQAGALRQGRKLIGIAAHSGLMLALDGATPVALVEADGPDIRVVRGFNL